MLYIIICQSITLQVHNPRARQVGPPCGSAQVSLGDGQEETELHRPQYGDHLLPGHVLHSRRPRPGKHRRGYPARPRGGALHHDLPPQARGSSGSPSMVCLQLRVCWCSGVSAELGSHQEVGHSSLATGSLCNSVGFDEFNESFVHPLTFKVAKQIRRGGDTNHEEN